VIVRRLSDLYTISSTNNFSN